MGGWTLLMLGIAFEVAGTLCLKLSYGFNNLLPSILCFIFFAVALSFITLSAKTLDISIVYAVWSGVGVVLITLIGAFWFAEQITLQTLFFITLILIGVFGLHHINATTKTTEPEHVHSVK